MQRILLVAVALLAVSNLALGAQSEMDLHPYSLQIAAEEVPLPEQEKEENPLQAYAANVLFELAVPAVTLDEEEPKRIVDNFVQEGIQLNPAAFSGLGKAWKKMQDKVRQEELAIKAKAALERFNRIKDVRKANKNVRHYKKIEGTAADPFSHQEALTPLEKKYAGLFRKYVALNKAYRRSCVRSRFYLRLHKYHWNVLLAADKRLRRLVRIYAGLRKKYNALGQRARATRAARKQKKQIAFLKNVIGLSKVAASASEAKVNQSEAKKQDLKNQASKIGQKMLEIRDEVGPMADAYDAFQNELNEENAAARV